MIYFIQEKGFFRSRIKIGYSESVETLKKRLSTLRGSSPSELVLLFALPGGKGEENILHERFSKYRLHREWFKCGLGLWLFIIINRYKFFLPDDLLSVDYTINEEDVEIIDPSEIPVTEPPPPTNYELGVLTAYDEVKELERPSWTKLHYIVTDNDVRPNSTQTKKYQGILEKHNIEPVF